MSEPEVIMMDSDEAASLQQVTGWVSRQGRFFGKEERTARWDGCTHRACEDCGAVIEKGYCTCSSCRSKKDLAYYLARPRKPWDGKTMLYSLAADKYYHSLEEAEDDLEEHDSLEDLRLVICEPIYLHPLEADHWHDWSCLDGATSPASIKRIRCRIASRCSDCRIHGSAGTADSIQRRAAARTRSARNLRTTGRRSARSGRRSAAKILLPSKEISAIHVAVTVRIAVRQFCAVGGSKTSRPEVEVVAVDVAVFVEVAL